MRRIITNVAAALLLTAALAVGAATAASAGDETDDFTFASFDADYYLSRADDGSSRLRTVETLVAEFPDRDQNRGIVRAIPLGFEGANLKVEVESVTDAAGDPVQFEETDEDGFREVSIGTDEFVRGEQTYVVTYERRNVTRSYEDTGADELYLDTNGTGWGQPFRELTATVHLNAGLTETLTGETACYVGGEGSTETCPIEESEGAFTATAADLVPGENVTIAIGFESGTFEEPARPRDSAWASVVPTGVGGLGLLSLIAVAIARRTRWRDARGRGILIAQYSPPDGIDLLEAGDLVGRTASAMSAQLVSFAVRGVVRLVDAGEGSGGGSSRYSLEYLSDADVSDGEREVLRVLFGSTPKAGDRRDIDTAAAEIAGQLRARVVAASDRVRERGLRRAIPPRQHVLFWTLGGAIAALSVVAFFVLGVLEALFPWTVAVLILALVAGIAVIALASKRTVVSDDGATTRDHLLGVRDYLQLAEAERFRMLQSPQGAERRAIDPTDPRQVVHLYERLLPYAVLFGVESQWARELERVYGDAGTTPEWYAGRSSFDAATFVVLMSTVNTQAAAATSVWTGSGSSSTYGGSTGGGFSGGGMGGGGGGGR